jgi:hypothetical protein
MEIEGVHVCSKLKHLSWASRYDRYGKEDDGEIPCAI